MNTLLFVAVAASATTLGVVNAECPSGWRPLNGDCFFVSTDFSEEELSWPAARDFCEDQGASLAQPTTAEQVKDVASLLAGDGNKFGTFWVGARNGNTKSYSWLNGDAVSAGWRKNPKQPSSLEPWRCVAIQYHAWTGHDDSGLEVWRCKNHGRFICQISNAPAPVECPSDWISNELGCFQIFEDHKNWWQAQKFCKEQGSHLAVPQQKTKRDIRVLTNMLNKDGLRYGDFWVGGKLTDAGYKWNDGEKVDEKIWRENQPNEKVTNKKSACMAVRYNEWHGHMDSGAEVSLCKDYRRFICQKV